MKIITASYAYMDIDAYAGCVAYAELLQKQGMEAKAVSTAPLNESVPPAVRAWKTDIESTYIAGSDDTFVIIDLSDPDRVDTFVELEKIDEVIDHHPGFASYWRSRLGKKAQLEQVGAACTQIYERWKEAGKLNEMSETSARLLVCGILDNTLNFGAHITTNRDRDAYAILMQQAALPNDWPKQYFDECTAAILHDLPKAIRNDSKRMQFDTFDAPLGIGQGAIWDAQELVSSFDVLKQTITGLEPHWFMNAISISEGKSYFITDDIKVQAWLETLLNVHFSGSVAVADRMWLRKEIRQQDIERHIQ